ncbi:MAG: metallophosphoesterase [Bacteroidota bacterium]|nr:metallophosphoesterase [Bacteroidota bacterium]
MKYLAFFIILGTVILMSVYVLIRGWQLLPHQPVLRVVFSAIFVCLFLIALSFIWLEHLLPLEWSKIFTFIGFTFVVAVIYSAVAFLLIDGIRLTNAVFHLVPLDQLMRFSRHAASLCLGIIAVAMIVGYIQFSHPVVTHLNLSIGRKPQHKTLTIVAASDLHVGNNIGKKQLRKYVNLINSLKPDLILLAGDITDQSIQAVSEQYMKEELRSLRAPLGVYAIRGNHEYYSGKPDAIAQYLRNSGITVLIDSVALIDHDFYLIGRDDRTNRQRKPLSELMKGIRQDLPTILLDHQPYNLNEAMKNGIDLQLSGHTHNGQLFPGNLIVKQQFERSYGYLRKGKTQYYVSSGLGLWGPQYRIGTKSEVVEIRLSY